MSSGNDDTKTTMAMKVIHTQWSQMLVDQSQQIESEESGFH